MRTALILLMAVLAAPHMNPARAASLALQGVVAPVCEARTGFGQGNMANGQAFSVDVFCNDTVGSVLALRIDADVDAAYSAVLPGRIVPLVSGEFTELSRYASAVKTSEIIEIRQDGGAMTSAVNVVFELRPMD
ncbi:hypothetical protein [Hyphomonas johnsonii]|uniref:Lipoprotein n=1 Tax=Hyphomonas johnsonii MHS-2 TaxID=1280950 RepID=A0A059FRX1_9PROT|nr:hypothetical protein [Hyphomonas johnsonii]KCZ93362.1 hypothetical protein HJO_05885 [Hyphomonas johnsonii MHS-2]